MKNLAKTIIMAIGLLWVYSAAKLEFVPHIVHIQKGNWGKTGIGDFDNDGKMDFTGGISGGALYWFRNSGTMSTEWERFDIDPKNGGCVGGEPADVDGDGLVDFISHGMWYRNSKENPGKSFEKFSFASGKVMCHDVIAVDVDQDGLIDAMNHEIKWWKNPGKEKVTELWESHTVTNVKYHGGIAPHGFGDIDGDKDIDVVGIGKWWKNLDGKGTQWEEKVYASWSKHDQNRIWIADFDGDGDQDITAGEGDSRSGVGAWFRNVDGKGEQWETIPLDMGGIKGDFHSIGAHDYDNDGDIDICLPKNGKGEGNEWLIFENIDGKATFERREVYKGHGAHETVWGDLDGDGDIDMVSKCWCGTATFVVLENKLDPKPPAAPGSVTAAVTAGNKVEISWTPPAGSSGKLTYIVYRNDVALDTVPEAKYLDSTAQAGVPYNYTVSVLMGAKEGEKSAPHPFTATERTLKSRLSFRALISHSGGKPVLEIISNASGPFSIELFNTRGARLALHSGEGRQIHGTIPLAEFKNGIYLVRLNMAQRSVIQRIALSR